MNITALKHTKYTVYVITAKKKKKKNLDGHCTQKEHIVEHRSSSRWSQQLPLDLHYN